MKFTTDERRKDKMRERLGKGAANLISDERYLPMFRNRQINYGKEFDFSVRLSKKKRDPRRYFAAIWSSKNVAKTVDWLRKLIGLERAKRAEQREKQRMEQQASLPFNQEGLEKLAAMKRQYNLIR